MKREAYRMRRKEIGAMSYLRLNAMEMTSQCQKRKERRRDSR